MHAQMHRDGITLNKYHSEAHNFRSPSLSVLYKAARRKLTAASLAKRNSKILVNIN